MKDYARYSFWLETSGDDLSPRAPLEESIDVDVAILGAGFSGLWTAYYLLQRDPSLNVAVVEAEIAGFGASGRNGGWCSSQFSMTPGLLRERYGTEATRDVMLAMYAAVDEVGRVCSVEGIDAHYQKSGGLHIARGAHQSKANDDAMRLYEELGLADHYQLLDAAATDERVRVSNAVGSLLIKDCAVVHPGRLVRGLARAVERLGATIYERTPVIDFEPGPGPVLVTGTGLVRARVIVLAGEAYLTRFKKLNRQLLPMYSTISLTEPLSDEQWEEIGWQNRECVASNRYHVDYLQRTSDGRILFGSRGAPYRYGGAIDDRYDQHAPTHEAIGRYLVNWFPMLDGIRFTHHWGGVFAVPRDWTTSIAYDPKTGVATARGYAGQGVSTTNLAGRLLADLITGTESESTRLPMANHASPNWEPEPLRWLGVNYVLWGYDRVDAQAERSGRPPPGGTLAERIGRH